jgi:hypothetical protein
MKDRKTLVDLRDWPAATDLARRFYRERGRLRQEHECDDIAMLLGVNRITVWHAYQRGDLGVPARNPERAVSWARRESFYVASRPCRQCGSVRRRPGDDMCFDCETARNERDKRSKRSAAG